MKKSGYQASLEYIEAKVDNIENNTNKIQRKREIIWFNPLFNKSVTSNVGRRFLNLAEKHFPKEHKLHKIFNKNTLKVSYSCSQNMTQIINSHNRKVKQPKKEERQPKKEESLSRNCRQKNDCPMDGKCRTMNTVYNCIASVPTKPDKSYTGLSEDGWKKRYYNHRKSFRNQRYQSETMLSSYVWETKRTIDQIPSLKWSIITVLPAYSNITKRCQLCLYEKYVIITYPDPENLLNKRSEIMSKCPHQRKFLLSNYDTRD